MSQVTPHPIPLVSPSLLGVFLGVPLAASVASRPYTVIVPLHNKEATIRATLESIFAQSRKPFQVIVVNDASTDRSRGVLEEFKDRIVIIDNVENIGKAASINEALRLVTTPYVLLVDADTVLEPRFAEEVMRGFTSGRVAGVSGVVLPTQIKTRTEHARLIEYLLGSSHKRTQLRLGGIWTLAGCAMMWRTDALRKIGGVPTETLVEDMDASWRVQATDSGDGTKYSLGFSPKAIAYTDEPKTFRDYISQTDRWFSIRSVVSRNARSVRRGLKLTAAWSFLEAVLPIVFLAAVSYLLYTGAYLSAAIILAFDALVLLLLTLHLASRYGQPRRRVLKGVGWFWLYRFVNAFQFWRRLIKPKRKW